MLANAKQADTYEVCLLADHDKTYALVRLPHAANEGLCQAAGSGAERRASKPRLCQTFSNLSAWHAKLYKPLPVLRRLSS